MAIELFGVKEEQVFGTEIQKNTKTHLMWQDMPMSVSQKKKKKGKMTAREFLQFFGTDVCRNIYNDVWAERLIKDIELESSLLAVVDDARFSNEVECVQKAGGKVIRLTRKPHEDEHDSETALDGYEGFDYVIHNADMDIDQTNMALMEVMKGWRWLTTKS